MAKFGKISLAVAASMLLASCGPAHTHSTGYFSYEPDVGYRWTDPKALFPGVIWAPGSKDPRYPNVHADSTPDQWVPDAGYQWGSSAAETAGASDYGSRATGADRVVHWHPGATHPEHDHILASQKPGYWQPQKGYRFLASDRLDVRWTPGLADPDRAHYRAAAQEGQWELEPGYGEVPGLFGGTQVAWMPGTPYPDQSCMIAGSEEGKWHPQDGYHLNRRADGQLEIEADATSTDWGGVIAGGVAAVVGLLNGEPGEDDSAFTTHVGRPISREIGKAGLKLATDSLHMPGACAGTVLPSSWSLG